MAHLFAHINESIADGKIFNVTFVKSDGTIRNMTCRKGVTKYRKSAVLKLTQKFNPNLVIVFDMQKREYRSFHQDKVLALKTKGMTFNVLGE